MKLSGHTPPRLDPARLQGVGVAVGVTGTGVVAVPVAAGVALGEVPGLGVDGIVPVTVGAALGVTVGGGVFVNVGVGVVTVTAKFGVGVGVDVGPPGVRVAVGVTGTGVAAVPVGAGVALGEAPGLGVGGIVPVTVGAGVGVTVGGGVFVKVGVGVVTVTASFGVGVGVDVGGPPGVDVAVGVTAMNVGVTGTPVVKVAVIVGVAVDATGSVGDLLSQAKTSSTVTPATTADTRRNRFTRCASLEVPVHVQEEVIRRSRKIHDGEPTRPIGRQHENSVVRPDDARAAGTGAVSPWIEAGRRRPSGRHPAAWNPVRGTRGDGP